MLRHIIAVVLVVLVGYGLTKAWPLIVGPSLHIDSPTDNSSYPGGIVTVRGRVERAAVFTLNGLPLIREQNGSFSSTLTFPLGGSILTFVATDRFGRTVTTTRTVFVPL